jgi:hypothetical protein
MYSGEKKMKVVVDWGISGKLTGKAGGVLWSEVVIEAET